MNLYLLTSGDVDARLVASVDSIVPVGFPELVAGDSPEFDIYIVDGEGNYDSTSGASGYIVRMGIGNPGDLPTSGTFTLTCGANTTAAIAYNATAAAIESALNAINSVVNAGGLDVTGTTGIYQIVWRTTGTKTAITGTATLLDPLSSVLLSTVIDGSGGTFKTEIIRVMCNPLTMQASWTQTTDTYGWTATLPMATLGIWSAIMGLTRIRSTVEIEITDPSGNPTTYLSMPVSIRNEVIASGMSGTYEIPSTNAETDPVFGASEAALFVTGDKLNLDTAYSWGDHALAGYLTKTAADTYYLKLTGGTLSGALGIGATPDASSILTGYSTTKGWLPPRMTLVQRDAIATPATGLFIFQTDGTAGFYYYDGANWVPMGAGAAATAYNPDTTKTSSIYYTGEGADRMFYFGPET